MSLTEEHINYIIKDMRYRGLILDEFDDELIDHICTMVENKMALGVRFIEAYEQVIKAFGATKGIQHIQKQTITINNNPRLMFKNHFKIAFRNLQKHKFYSLINVLGLAIGIACCMLLSLFIVDELSYDRYHEKSDRIFRVTMEAEYGGNKFDMAVTPAPMSAALISDYPEVEIATRIRKSGTWLFKKKEGDVNIIEKNILFADSSLFDVFTIPFIEGDPKTALTNKKTLVISESTAKKYFGSENALNQTLILDNESTYTVTGVFKDMPLNGHFHCDAIITMLELERSKSNHWLSNNFHTYVLLKEGSDAESFRNKLPLMIEKYIGPQMMQMMGKTLEDVTNYVTWIKHHLQPLTDIHLHSQLGVELEPNSDIKYIYIFSIIGLFLLLIACINFMNLSTARSANRAKEVGVRKVLGSFRSHLIRQFLTESILLTILAFVLAFGLAVLVLPIFNQLSGKELSIPLASPIFWLASLGAIFLIGIISGVYPAFFLSAFKPVSVLKGRLATGSKSGIIRSLLVVFQFSISIILVVGTFTIFKQLNYIQNKKLGFSKEQVLVIDNIWALGNDQIEAFKTKVNGIAGITNSTVSGYLPVTSSWRNDNGFYIHGQPIDETSVSMQYWKIDHDYIATLDIEVLEGRGFSREFASDSSAIIINERAAMLFGFDNPIGERIATLDREMKETTYTVIGVVANFHFQSMKDNIDALCFVLGNSNGFGLFKTETADIQNTLGQVQKEWEALAPDQPFVYSFLEEEFDDMYKSEQKIGGIFTTFACLAIFIACLGLFALAAFTAEQRTKEIGVRKVLGASVRSIVLLLSKEFIKLVGIAFLVATPLAWWGIDMWLATYSYRTSIGIEVYLLAGLVAFFIAWITMSYQSVKAASSNPVKALRSE